MRQILLPSQLRPVMEAQQLLSVIPWHRSLRRLPDARDKTAAEAVAKAEGVTDETTPLPGTKVAEPMAWATCWKADQQPGTEGAAGTPRDRLRLALTRMCPSGMPRVEGRRGQRGASSNHNKGYALGWNLWTRSPWKRPCASESLLCSQRLAASGASSNLPSGMALRS